MGKTNKKNRAFAMILAIMLVFGLYIPTTVEQVSAAETSLSSKTWSSSMTAILKSKDGTSYEAAGLCTGYVCWAIQQAGLYDISSWPDNMTVSTLKQRLKDRGVTKVDTDDAKAGDIVFFGDEHVAILGADGKLHHNYSAGVHSGEHTIDWWVKNGGNKAGEATVYRGFTQEIDVSITINKESADKTFVDGNACYSLAGAKYGVYSGSTLLKTITTNASGVAKGTISVMPDIAKNLTIKELESSQGYGKDPTVYKKDGSSGKVTITSKEPPAGDPITVLLYKADNETGKFLNAGELKKYYPQKAGSLAGAVFEVKFYGAEKNDIDGEKALRTWYVETDENGYVRLGEEWLADGYTQSAFYKDAATGLITLPLGTVTIQEIKAPEGYLLNDKLFVSDITQSGEDVIVNTYQEPVIKEQIKRGDLDLTKIADDTSHRLGNVPFMITALNEDGKEVANGESHIIVTDENGYASTANSFNAHSNKTNANDKAWDGTKIDESKLDATAGIWFGETSAIKASKGALPYGKYRIDELPCKANKDYTLIKGVKVTISRNGYTVGLGTLSDKKNEMETTVWDSDLNEERVTLARDNITLTDRVTMKGLEKGETYTLKGTIMDKETGEVLKVDGKAVKSEKTFKTAGTSFIVDMDFSFDASGLAGKEIVVFQKLMQGSLTIASHEDLENPNQTLRFLEPFIGTTASDPEFGTNYSLADEEVTIIDKVKYSNILRGGYSYEMVGYLMDKETGEPVIVDGKEVTVREKFTSNKASGSVEMKFTFDGSALAGKDIVVFEELYFDGELIAEHKDLSDEGQTIHFPQVKTKARDSETEDNISFADGKVTVIDTISYSNVKANEEYTAEGSLVDKDTGKILVTRNTTFTAESAEGKVEVTFEFDANGLAGKDTVIFENLIFKGKTIAKHEDINDEKQTINFPEIKTKAWDSETKDNLSFADDKVTVIDTISYENLLPNEKYALEGSLIDKETGNVIAEASSTFKAKEPAGKVEVEFTFDANAYKNKDVVVYESLFFKGVLVAEHKDSESKEQTVHFPEIKTKAVEKSTGKQIAYYEGGKEVTIVDTISYKNLIAGKQYTVSGRLMDKETGKPFVSEGKEVTAEKTFTAEEANGETKLEFTFSMEALGDKTLVAFEKLLIDEHIIASHEDIEDKEQSVVLKEKPANAVKTGDNMDIFFWAAIAAAALIAGTVISISRRKRSH